MVALTSCILAYVTALSVIVRPVEIASPVTSPVWAELDNLAVLSEINVLIASASLSAVTASFNILSVVIALFEIVIAEDLFVDFLFRNNIR